MQTIGERLEEARKKRGISIREAAEATKIRGEYLQKFEGNQFEIGLTEIYTRGFLRGYANYLRIPSDRLLSDYTALRGGEPRVRQPSRDPVEGHSQPRNRQGLRQREVRQEPDPQQADHAHARPSQLHPLRPGQRIQRGGHPRDDLHRPVVSGTNERGGGSRRRTR